MEQEIKQHIERCCPTCGQTKPPDPLRLAREYRAEAEKYAEAHRHYEWYTQMAENYERWAGRSRC